MPPIPAAYTQQLIEIQVKVPSQSHTRSQKRGCHVQGSNAHQSSCVIKHPHTICARHLFQVISRHDCEPGPGLRPYKQGHRSSTAQSKAALYKQSPSHTHTLSHTHILQRRTQSSKPCSLHAVAGMLSASLRRCRKLLGATTHPRTDPPTY